MGGQDPSSKPSEEILAAEGYTIDAIEVNGKKIEFAIDATYLYPDKHHVNTDKWYLVYPFNMEVFKKICADKPEYAKEIATMMLDNCRAYLALDKEAREGIRINGPIRLPPGAKFNPAKYDPIKTDECDLHLDFATASVEVTQGILEQILEAIK